MTDGRDKTLVGRPGDKIETPVTDATEPTVAAPISASTPPRSRPSPTGSGSQRAKSDSKVGEEIRRVTIDRFDTMASSRFELLDELARGGLGRVLRARDPRTNRIVAIKEVLSPTPDMIVRFAREAIVTANLQHPSIVPVYEVGRWENGEPYYAMKLVKGRTLDELIRETTTTAQRVALVPHVIDVADALAYAHSESVIHRDLKPSNVLVGSYGETVVIDWGLAKNLATGEELEAVPYASTLPPDSGNETLAGSVLGTPAYMPPEQAYGEPLDEHADVYAIGAILYNALSGARPYADATNLEDLMTRVRSVPPRPLAELAPDVAPELIAIVDKAMSREPSTRYATAAGLAADLRSYQAGKLVAAHHYTSGQLIRRWVGKHRGLVGATAIALVVLIIFGALSFSRIAAERDVANRESAAAMTERTAALDARALAERRFADSLDELARQALLAGTPDRTLALLAGEIGARPITMTPAQSVLASQARAAYAGLVAYAPAEHAGVTTAQPSSDGKRLFTISSDGHARAWDMVAQRELWEADDVAVFELSPDEKWLGGISGSGAIEIRSADTGAVDTTMPGSSGDFATRANKVHWSADNTHVAAISPTGAVLLAARGGTAVITDEHHSGAAYALAWAPDGQRFATTGGDGVTLVHDTTGATVARLVDVTAPSPVTAVVWNTDDVLITGDEQGTARVWSVHDKRVLQHLTNPAGILGFVIGGTPEARWLAMYGYSELVTLWDASVVPMPLRAQLPGHRLGVDYAVTDGARLITSDDGGGVYVWDPATGEQLHAPPEEGTAVGVSAHGDHVTAFSRGRTRVFRFSRDGALRHVDGHAARIRELEFASDGTLWSASNDGTARGFDPSTGQTIVLGSISFREAPITQLGGPPRPPGPHGLRSLTLAPDGAVVTAAEDGAIIVWDGKTGAVRATWTGHTGRARKVAFAPDGKTAFSVGDTTLRKWDVATGKELAHADLGGPAWDVVVFDHGEQVATLTQANMIVLWKTADLARISPAEIPLHDELQDLAVDGDDLLTATPTRLFLLGHGGATVRDSVATSVHATSVTARLIAGSSASNELALYDPTTLAIVRAWHTPEYQLAVRLRPDGALLASIGGHRIRLWDTATGDLLAESPELPPLLAALAWSADGQRVAAAGGSGTIWIWDLAPGEPAQLVDFARCVSPWRLDDATLVARTPSPNDCTGQLAGR